jgi:outer membrane protein OmpA-like peptidoglycan-associated protein
MPKLIKPPTRSLLCHGIGAALFTLSLGCLADTSSGYLQDGNGKPVLISHGACLQVAPLDSKDKQSECYQRANTPVQHHIEPLPRDEFGFMLPAEKPAHPAADKTPQPVANSPVPGNVPHYTSRTVRFTTPAEFSRSRAGLSAQNRAALLHFIDSLEQYRGVESIHIIGHTDLVGKRRYNLWLAGKRAESVQLRLLSLGVDPRTLSMTAEVGGGRSVEIEIVVRIPTE